MEFFAGIWELICMLNSTIIRTRTAIDLASELDVILTTDSSYWLFNETNRSLSGTDEFSKRELCWGNYELYLTDSVYSIVMLIHQNVSFERLLDFNPIYCCKIPIEWNSTVETEQVTSWEKLITRQLCFS